MFANVQWQEKEKDTTGATSTVDDSVTHIGRSILVPNMPRVVGRESGSQGDAESELLTKKAMMDMPLSCKRSPYILTHKITVIH